MNDDAAHQQYRELLGSYALGHLGADESDPLRAHLDGCSACREELALISPVAERLDALDPDVFETLPTPPAGLGDLIRSQVAEERRAKSDDELTTRREAHRRSRRGKLRIGAVAAAAVLVVLGAGAAVGRLTAPEVPTVPKESIAMQPASGSRVTVESADLVNHTWGTELRIVAVGFEAGETFRAEFRTTEGEVVPAGEFIGVGAATMTCNLQSASLREDLTEVVVTDDAGHTVLRSSL